MTDDLRLRDVTDDDLAIFYGQQLDPEANRMAAFTAKDPADRGAFADHWATIMGDKTVVNQTIVVGGKVVGHIATFTHLGQREVTYWIGKEFWGQGIATKALGVFLLDLKARPLYARAAKDNIASIRVLEKCDFTVSGEDRGFSNARGEEVEEFIFRLEA